MNKEINKINKEMKSIDEIERSIITKFRPSIYRLFARAIEKYELIKEDDKIAICISGGKDSFLLAKCMQEIKKHGKINFELEYINMDPGYPEEVSKRIIELAEYLEIPLHNYKTNFFKVAEKQIRGKCYLCSRMRRGSLYETAEKLGCNKIALGHHFDDCIETILLNVLWGGQYKTMMPKLKSDNFKGMELIRPLCLVQEKSIIHWMQYNNIEFVNPECPINKEGRDNSKRTIIKNLIDDLEKINPNVKKSIYRSSENVHLGAIIKYKSKGKYYNFLDKY